MNFKEYTVLAKRTITYDSDEKLLFCSMAGLLGEYGEWLEHMENASNKSLIIKECGDICWYLAILVDYLKLDLNVTAVSPYFSLEHNGFQTISLIQEVMKKMVRDNPTWYPDEIQKGKLELLFSSLLAGVQNVCLIEQVNFSDVLHQNIEKLADRAKRGVLKGSGDLR